MNARTPPPPGKDLGLWARQLYNYLVGEAQIKQRVEPSAMLLAHITGDERASVDGLILYDPTAEEPVYSKGGAFVPFAASGPPVVVPDFATEAEVIAGTSPDTIVSPATLQAKIDAIPAPPVVAGVPTGAVMHFAGDAPTGWLDCDGAAVIAADHPALHTYLLAAGSPYGVVGSDPKLPDLRGEFLRGADLGRGVDAGRVFGSAQGDAIRNIIGDFGYSSTSGASARTGGTLTGPFTVGGNRTNGPSANSGLLGADLRFDASRQVPTANENRPRNVALRACIKT